MKAVEERVVKIEAINASTNIEVDAISEEKRLDNILNHESSSYASSVFNISERIDNLNSNIVKHDKINLLEKDLHDRIYTLCNKVDEIASSIETQQMSLKIERL